MTLRTRIAAVASVSVALAVLAAAIGLYVAVRSDLRGEVDSALRARTRAFVGSGGPGGGPPGASPGADLPDGDGDDRPGGGVGGFPGTVEPAPFGAASGYVEFISPQGEVFVPGGQGAARRKIPVTAAERAIAARGSGAAFSERNIDGTQLRILTTGTGMDGAVLVAQPLTQVEHELSHLLLILVLIGVGGVVLAGLLGALVARTALAPIARFTQRTETLTGSLDLSRRIETQGRDELARLAGSFNATLDALERSVQAQRHLIADASHELRTPISSLRANIQVLGEAERLPREEQESLRADIVAELDELTALVGDVVELARGATPDGAVDDVRLDELVRAAVASARRRSARGGGGAGAGSAAPGGGDAPGESAEGVRFELDLEPTVVRGQAERIGRAVSNLVDNARKWSPEGASVQVTLKDGVLSVRDHGPGFREADLPFVFDRFYRAQAARGLPGSGLGLAIVRQAAEACGGFAEAQNAPDGGALLRVGFGEAAAAS